MLHGWDSHFPGIALLQLSLATQSAFFDFCLEKCHQSMACVQVEAVKISADRDCSGRSSKSGIEDRAFIKVGQQTT